jgi:hypothetical protein
MGYASTDIIDEVYSHSFLTIIAGISENCKSYAATFVFASVFLNTQNLYPQKFQMKAAPTPTRAPIVAQRMVLMFSGRATLLKT